MAVKRRGSILADIGVSVALAIAILAHGLPAEAHHSGAMFDDDKTVTLTGTVKVFQWTNPHCWIQVQVPGEGGPVEWSVEMGAPVELFRGGWRPGTLKGGEKITVDIHPMRDGTRGGLFVSAKGADGRPFGKSADAAR
jgi:hypothetical protein